MGGDAEGSYTAGGVAHAGSVSSASASAPSGGAGQQGHLGSGEKAEKHDVEVGVGGGRARKALLIAAIIAIAVIIAGVAQGAATNPTGLDSTAPPPVGTVIFELAVTGSVDAVPLRCSTATAAGVDAATVLVTREEVAGSWVAVGANAAANTAACPPATSSFFTVTAIELTISDVPVAALPSAAAAVVALWGDALQVVSTTTVDLPAPSTVPLPTHSPSPTPSLWPTPSPSPTPTF